MFQKIFQSKIATVVLVVVLMIFLINVLKDREPLAQLQKEATNLNQKITEAKENNAQLNQQKDFLHSDAYLERQAREKLNYKKPDEEVVLIYKDQTPSKSDENLVKKGSWLARIMGWFK